MNWQEQFRNPSSEYRSAPFWSWNDDLEEERLVEQIREIHAQGIGGFFMHSRVGLITPYMQKDWMDRVRVCVREAKTLGMKAWLYDEDSYPSGHAGGLVPSRGKEYRAKGLRMEVLHGDSSRAPGNVVAAARIQRAGGKPSVAECIDTPQIQAAARDGEVAVFHLVHAKDDTWFNGWSYVDTKDPKAVDAFIEVTHEAYRREFGNEFGSTIPGIFTDEPQASATGCPGPCVPWTKRFPEYFRAKKGYDILPHLASLFFDVGNYRKIRLDYWDVHTRLFAETFDKRIFDWCERNNLKLTGHVWEHTFPSTTHTGSTMPTYEYMQMPGIDMLFNQYEYERPRGQGSQFGNIMVCREVASVAHQMGRQQVLSETYGGSGWELTFEDQKRIGDWEYVLGVNFLCQHLSLYSLRGCRKRDFPPSFLPHQPWWSSYRLLGDYFARLSFMLSQGEPVVDVLVLHPYSSIWALTGATQRDARADQIARDFHRLNKMLCKLHRAFDLGDDTIIAKHGRVEGGSFVVGKAAYRAVIVPPCLLLRETTFRLLKKFAAAGGLVVFTEPVPTSIEAVQSEELASFFGEAGVRVAPLEPDAIAAALSSLEPEVTIEGAPTVYYQLRRAHDRHILFLSNVDKERRYELQVGVKASGPVTRWDPTTGEITAIESREENGRLTFSLDMPPVGSQLLVLGIGEQTAELTRPRRTTGRIEASGWQGYPTTLNAAILDWCAYRIGDGEWSETMYVQRAFKEIREHYGLVHDNANRGVQFWLAYQHMKPLGGDKRVALRYEFDCQLPAPSDAPLYFVTETPERFRIAVNGHVVDTTRAEAWIAPAFHKIPIGEHLLRGRNEILVECEEFAEDVEIEACYLVGRFGAEWDGKRIVLRAAPDSVKLGDWCEQGYPFYAGSMVYRAVAAIENMHDDERVVLCLGKWAGALAKVALNGQEIGPIAWPPYEIDVTDAVKKDENEIAVEVVNTLRNLLGPHHRRDYVPGMVAPSAWFEPDNWRDDYDLVSYGLFESPWLERRV